MRTQKVTAAAKDKRLELAKQYVAEDSSDEDVEKIKTLMVRIKQTFFHNYNDNVESFTLDSLLNVSVRIRPCCKDIIFALKSWRQQKINWIDVFFITLIVKYLNFEMTQK